MPWTRRRKATTRRRPAGRATAISSSGRALLGAGRCLLSLGRPEGRLRLQDAHAALMALNAKPLLAEADTALGNTTALRHNRRGESG